MTKNKDNKWSGFTAKQLDILKTGTSNPKLFDLIEKEMKSHLDNHERLLIYRDDNTSPQNAVVVTLESVSKRFASGYTLNKIDGSKIPYTLNYSALVDRANKTYLKVEKK